MKSEQTTLHASGAFIADAVVEGIEGDLDALQGRALKHAGGAGDGGLTAQVLGTVSADVFEA